MATTAPGLVRLVAVSSPVRLGGWLGLAPTWEEMGVPCTIGTWRGVVAPPGLPSEQTEYWEQAILTATGDDEWKAALDRHLWTPSVLGAAATRAFHAEQADLLSVALTDLGLVAVARG